MLVGLGLLEDLEARGLGEGALLLDVRLVLDERALRVGGRLLGELRLVDARDVGGLLGVDGLDLRLAASVDERHLGLALGVDLGLHALRLGLLGGDQLLLRRDQQARLLLLDQLVVALDALGDARLGDADRNHLDARVVLGAVGLQRLGERLVEPIELVDVDLLQRVRRAELVDLVVDLVKDPKLVVVHAVVLDGVEGVRAIEPIDHFDLVCVGAMIVYERERETRSLTHSNTARTKVDHHSSRGTARNVGDRVGLERRLWRRAHTFNHSINHFRHRV